MAKLIYNLDKRRNVLCLYFAWHASVDLVVLSVDEVALYQVTVPYEMMTIDVLRPRLCTW